MDKITGILESLSRRVENIEQKNLALERRYEELVKKNSKISEELTRMSDNSAILKYQILEAAVAESQNQLSRLHNIVIQGVPESDSGSLEDRARHDAARVDELLREIGASETNISNVRRVGRKRKDGSRLLLLRVADPDGRRRILSKSKSLRTRLIDEEFLRLLELLSILRLPSGSATRRSKRRDPSFRSRPTRRTFEMVVSDAPISRSSSSTRAASCRARSSREPLSDSGPP